MADNFEMDKAAQTASEELERLDSPSVKKVANWWASHFKTAGHRRLGRALVAYSRDHSDKS